MSERDGGGEARRAVKVEDKASYIDETLPPLEKIRTYSSSEHISHKLYIVNDFPTLSLAVGFSDSLLEILPAIENLVYDLEVNVREAIAQSLPALYFALQKTGGSKFDVDKNHKFFAPVIELLKDKQQTVREMVSTSVVEISMKMDPSLITDVLCPILDKLSTDTEEQHRVQATTIMNKISPRMGSSWILSFVLPYVSKFSQDVYFNVRVAFVSTLPTLFEVLGKEKSTEHLLPVYVTLSKDEIWSVRKACAQIIVLVTKSVTPEVSDELVECFEAYVNDSTRWVRTAAYSILGEFIATFEGKEEVPSSLVKHFCLLATDNPQMEFCEAEHVLYCAFNFPAVLQTVGPSRWTELSSTYMQLCDDLQWKVRRTLAFSLHLVASMLGRELSDTVLLPIFEKFLKDLDEVKVGVIKHMSKFLKIISDDLRFKYFYIMDEIQHSAVNWRFRKLIARQIGDLSSIFSAEVVHCEIVPFAAALMVDPVASVRLAIQSEVC
eukprot:TRINITY_DN3323_c0_g1_i1.p1 TRINITY_DN3323_c0_g1~~TRINITY_DN3323_c0_g1_i1.p1  ORF type:complete len:494 (-),score=82.36 TRINITY_DN3323_c0_g1_i1:450-1931(-)